jgi:hypothetical protein
LLHQHHLTDVIVAHVGGSLREGCHDVKRVAGEEGVVDSSGGRKRRSGERVM